MPDRGFTYLFTPDCARCTRLGPPYELWNGAPCFQALSTPQRRIGVPTVLRAHILVDAALEREEVLRRIGEDPLHRYDGIVGGEFVDDPHYQGLEPTRF